MATDAEPATRDPPAAAPTSAPARGRGRGGRGRGGRGRGGRGGGASSAAAVNKTTAGRGGRGGVRRGRAKNFSDSRVQAAYERQRDLKSLYQTVTAALKPALQELAERNVDEILADPDKYRQVDEYLPVISQLQSRLDKSLNHTSNRYELDLGAATKRFEGDQYLINQQFENAVADLFEQFYEGQHNRLRILASLHEKGLPVDVRDDQYEYKTITDDHFDKEFGIYESYKDGHIVPYPSRVPGTEMWQKARDNDAAASAAALANAVTTVATSTPTRGRGRGRGGAKRKPAGDPDGMPTPKRSTRNTADDMSVSMAPVPAKGLLASAAEADLPAETPLEDASPGATPEPSSFMAQLKAKMGDNEDAVNPREQSPPLPRNLHDPDEFGVRLYNAKTSAREKGANSRLLAPRPFLFYQHEIGFRDSQNDSSKGHTVNKRGKYLDQPDSNGMHYDHWCIGYDYSKTTEKDFDQELVKKHNVHPRYGIWLDCSVNELEEPIPFTMPGKPVVFVAEPSGRISHASRSFQSTVNHRRNFDDPYRHKMSAALRRFCKIEEISPKEVSINNYLPTHAELEARSLGTAEKELESRPVIELSSDVESESADGVEPKHEEEKAAQQAEEPCHNMFVLIAASEYVDTQASTAPAPKKQTKYDAIRDIFVTESQPEPAKQTSRYVANEDADFLNVLANAAVSNERGLAEQPIRNERPNTGYALIPPFQEAQVPISNERDIYERAPISNERGMYEQTPMSNEREMYERPGMYEQPPTSNEREMYEPPPISNERGAFDQASAAYPAPPRPSEAPYPMSSERDASYMPPTPSQTYRDPRMSIESHNVEAPRRAKENVPPQPVYQPSRQPEPPVEASPYGRQPVHQPEPPMYHQRPYEPTAPHQPAAQHQAPPPQAGPGPPPEYRTPYGYGPPPHEQGSYPPQPPHGYQDPRDQRDYRDPREPPMPPQSRPYDHSYEDRRMSGYSESPTFSRPHWQQPSTQGPPGLPQGAPQPPPPSGTPSQTTGYSLPPPSRGPFSGQASAEPLPPLRPSRGRLMGAAPPEESNIDPAMRQAPPPQQSSMNTFYSSTPSRGYQSSYPPPPPERMIGTPQQGYMGSPPYGPPSGSPTFSTIMMHSPEQGSGIFRHRSTHSGSGPPGSAAAAAAAAQNSKYRQLQPAPIPPHRNWSSKPELKTIPYDHKDSGGNTAQLPSSGPTTIRGWQVNPQSRRALQAQREKTLGKAYEPPAPANDKEDSR